jgi:uncharacterized protein YjeT (DUF2065 family)
MAASLEPFGPAWRRWGRQASPVARPGRKQACRPAMTDLATALALVLVVEGVLWALVPDGMKQAAAKAALLDSGPLRMGGLAFAVLGVALVWAIRG